MKWKKWALNIRFDVAVSFFGRNDRRTRCSTNGPDECVQARRCWSESYAASRASTGSFLHLLDHWTNVHRLTLSNHSRIKSESHFLRLEAERKYYLLHWWHSLTALIRCHPLHYSALAVLLIDPNLHHCRCFDLLISHTDIPIETVDPVCRRPLVFSVSEKTLRIIFIAVCMKKYRSHSVTIWVDFYVAHQSA